MQQERPLSDLEKEGVILEKITPKAVIVAALEARIIIRKEDWMRALDDRNRMSHVYSKIVFARIVNNKSIKRVFSVPGPAGKTAY